MSWVRHANGMDINGMDAATRTFVLLTTTLLAHVSLSTSDPSDQACLTHLHKSFKDSTNSLQNWTDINLANPCSGFTSFLPGAVCNSGRIYKLSLTNLALRGSISSYISNCTNLQSLDFSSNSLTGPIPPDLRYLVNLAVLNLSSNRFVGGIPAQLALCTYLNVIDFHGNCLSGQIPQQLGLLARLSSFDVSNNQLSGEIPASLGNRTGNSLRFNASSFSGNKDLSGYPLSPSKSKELSVMTIIGIGLGSGMVSLVLSFAGVCVWLKITDHKMALENDKNGHFMPDY